MRYIGRNNHTLGGLIKEANFDNDLFKDEFLPHIDAMYKFACRLTLNEEEAKDLVQETFLSAIKNSHQFSQGTNAKAWLYSILKNSFNGDYRKRVRRKGHIELVQLEKLKNSGQIDALLSKDVRLELQDQSLGDEITTAMEMLSKDYRMVITLSDLEEFTYEEMADILEIPIGTVRSRLFRARKALRTGLDTYAKKMGFNKGDQT